MNRRTDFVARPLLAAMMALTLGVSIANAQTSIKPGWNLFSPQDDAQIGQQSAAQAEQQLPILNDPTAEAYLNRIGQRLAANAGGPQFQYRFQIVNAADINAFALPGGFVYINRGVLDQAKNEGELAGVVAHEIAHVALRHGTHQASKAYAAQAGLSILGGILGGQVGNNTAQILNTVGGLGLNALFLKYSRDLESQADIRGAQIMAATGYSPADMVSFFRTLESVDKSKKTNWMSDHPAPPDRIARIQQEGTMLHVAGNPTTNAAELRSIQADMRRYGAAPTSQQIAAGTAPATTNAPARSTSRGRATGTAVQVDPPANAMRTYTSPSGIYRISYPDNWEVFQEGQTGATIAPRGGISNVGGRNEVVYGAVINHYDPFGATARGTGLRGSGGNVYTDQISIEDATNDLVGQVQRASPYLKVIQGTGQQFTAGGGRALAIALRGKNPNTGVTERVNIITRQLQDAHLVYMLFVTPDKDASRYSSVLQAMAGSLQVSGQGH
jgi:beta-barrel assembly-enhancing protease